MLVDYVRVYQAGVVATENMENKGIYFYPNPVNDDLNIMLENVAPSQIVTITTKIYDIQGVLVKTTVSEPENGRFSIKNLSGLPIGMYFLVYENQGEMCSLKFLKQ